MSDKLSALKAKIEAKRALTSLPKAVETESVPKQVSEWDNILQFQDMFPDFDAQEFVNSMEEIKRLTMANSSEDLPNHCAQILKNLNTHSDLSHLLTPKQIGVVVNGLIKYAQIKVTKAPKAGKKLTAAEAAAGLDLL